MDIAKRNKSIREAGIATRTKRKSQVCKTFRFKVDMSSLRAEQKEVLKMMFVEAKWIYNYILSQMNSGIDLKSISYKELNCVPHYNKDKELVWSNINYISTSVKQELLQQIRVQLYSLSRLKKKDYSVGILKYKTDYSCIPFKQYGVSHKIVKNKIKLQGIKKHIHVRGLKQLNNLINPDYTTSKLLKIGEQYYITLTTFSDPISKETNGQSIGIDMGIKEHITLSNGKKINVSIKESERLQMLQARIARSTKGSNNRYKLRFQLQKEYYKMYCKKIDTVNKIVSELSKYEHIYFQDEQIGAWKGQFGSEVHHSILGLLKQSLKRLPNSTMLSKWEPTTKLCRNCGTHIDIKTSRIFSCPNCGTSEDRDVHAALNMVYIGELKYSAREPSTVPV